MPIIVGGGPDGATAELLERAASSGPPVQTGGLRQRGMHIFGHGTTG